MSESKLRYVWFINIQIYKYKHRIIHTQINKYSPPSTPCSSHHVIANSCLVQIYWDPRHISVTFREGHITHCCSRIFKLNFDNWNFFRQLGCLNFSVESNLFAICWHSVKKQNPCQHLFQLGLHFLWSSLFMDNVWFWTKCWDSNFAAI